MDVQTDVAFSQADAKLFNRIVTLEAEVQRERAARQLVEQERDGIYRKLAAVMGEMDRLKAQAAAAENAARQAELLPEPVEVVSTTPTSAQQSQLVPVQVTPAVEEISPLPQSVAQSQPRPTPPAVIQPVAVTTPVQTVNAADAKGAEQRRDKRVETQQSATFWHSGMPKAAHCTISDKSSGGARLECLRSGPPGSGSGFIVGNQITLTFENAIERTSVVSVVMWAVGNRCGVRFVGQFHTTARTPRAPVRQKPIPRERAGSSLAKRLLRGH